MDDELILFAENSIRQYLSVRPLSADTLEGIHQWWISWPAHPESIMITAAALDNLASHGVVESLQLGNRKIWRNANRTDS